MDALATKNLMSGVKYNLEILVFELRLSSALFILSVCKNLWVLLFNNCISDLFLFSELSQNWSSLKQMLMFSYSFWRSEIWEWLTWLVPAQGLQQVAIKWRVNKAVGSTSKFTHVFVGKCQFLASSLGKFLQHGNWLSEEKERGMD